MKAMQRNVAIPNLGPIICLMEIGGWCIYGSEGGSHGGIQSINTSFGGKQGVHNAIFTKKMGAIRLRLRVRAVVNQVINKRARR